MGIPLVSILILTQAESFRYQHSFSDKQRNPAYYLLLSGTHDTGHTYPNDSVYTQFSSHKLENTKD